MTTYSLYPRGRLNTSASRPSQHAGKPNYDLIAHLRSIRENGDEAMAATEKYDPNFSVKLSSCTDVAAADALLTDWVERRAAVLQRTQSELRRVWQAAQKTGNIDREGNHPNE